MNFNLSVTQEDFEILLSALYEYEDSHGSLQAKQKIEKLYEKIEAQVDAQRSVRSNDGRAERKDLERD